MQFTSLISLLTFATAALSAPTPQDGTLNPGLKPFEVNNLNKNTTTTAAGVKVDTHFYITDPNSGLDTVCNAEDVSPTQLYPCNGLPQFIFSEDFKQLGIFWTWPEGEAAYTSGNGTADLSWQCLDADAQGLQQCATDVVYVPVKIAN